MRAFASTMLTIGAVLSAFTNSFAGQWVFADSVEPGTVEAGLDTSARCNPEDIAVHAPQPSSTSERPCPAHTREAGETARARAYLIATATPGYTMTGRLFQRARYEARRWGAFCYWPRRYSCGLLSLAPDRLVQR